MKRSFLFVAFGLWLAGCASALREPPSVDQLAGGGARGAATDVDRWLHEASEEFARQTLESVRRASARWLEAAAADESRIEGLIGASRAGVWLSGKELDAQAREAAALSAVQSAQLCRRAIAGEPACAYWLAVALGVQARERRSTALDALPEMVKLLEQAAAERPGLEHAGPHRVLALVLLRAPGWPAGPGDADRGLVEARRAVELAPDYPPNQLCLAEALTMVGDSEGGSRAYARAADLALLRVESGEIEARDWLAEARAGHPQDRDR